jgi:hypothetical protein
MGWANREHECSKASSQLLKHIPLLESSTSRKNIKFLTPQMNVAQCPRADMHILTQEGASNSSNQQAAALPSAKHTKGTHATT